MNPQPSLDHTPSSRRTGGRGKGCRKLKAEAWKAFSPCRDIGSALFLEKIRGIGLCWYGAVFFKRLGGKESWV